jgi:predicted ribosomally synthesized peptide with SipW-like signal peptide
MLRRGNNRDADQPRRPGRIRTALALGVVLGTGAVGVHAYWSDTATLTTGSFAAGSLDITLDGNATGVGTGYTKTAFGLSSMLPGESIASTIAVGNGGTVPLSYTATATATGDLASAIAFKVYTGGTASNSGTAATGDRAGSCGGTFVSGPTVLTDTPQSMITTPRSVAVGSSENICILASLSTSASSSLQGSTATAMFAFAATQPGH